MTTFLLMAAFAANAAVPTYYNDRPSFEALTNPGFIVDDYSDPAYIFIQNNAIMSAVIGETDYQTTGFGDLNIVSGGTYCAGCNGSFLLMFQTTSFSQPGTGTNNIAFDVVSNDVGTPYHAYVEFGDGTFDDVALPAGASFFGVIEYVNTVVSIHLGLANGGITTNGSFQLDNLTVGEGCDGLGPDTDGDGIEDDCDNCLNDANVDQEDGDSDGLGDVCDDCPDDPQNDSDGDGVCGDVDPCPRDNPDDTDLDGVCDTDDMCDGFDDNLDADADGFPDDCDDCPNTPQPGLRDDDGDGFGLACDCNDDDGAINPDAPEICDGIDNDCDEQIDEEPVDGTTWYADNDMDGEGDPNDSILDCNAPNGRVENSLDCDDSDASIFSLATEVCDAIDNNCNGEIDELIADCETADGNAASGGSCSCGSAGPAGGMAWLLLLGGMLLRRRY